MSGDPRDLRFPIAIAAQDARRSLKTGRPAVPGHVCVMKGATNHTLIVAARAVPTPPPVS